VSALKKQGKPVDEAAAQALYDRIAAQYDAATEPVYAAARLWIDAIIDPQATRHWISIGIEAANAAPAERPFNPGVIQT
jgi:3-methylcrotonyl-CoA carboxylase beta subunit